jgi:predicted DNA-binding antitoxin AbrB/MazE fold protein
MLVINGFFENGVFVPNKPIAGINGRQRAVLNIEEENREKERQEHIKAWKEFGDEILNSDEILEGEPERFHFRTPEEIEAL